jgi:hypothetical protein
MARPRFASTEENRRQAKALAAMGTPHDLIAKLIGIAPKTLRKHFDQELFRGEVEANTQVAKTLFQICSGVRYQRALGQCGICSEAVDPSDAEYDQPAAGAAVEAEMDPVKVDPKHYKVVIDNDGNDERGIWPGGHPEAQLIPCIMGAARENHEYCSFPSC